MQPFPLLLLLRVQVGQHLAASHQSPEAATLLCYILKCYYAVMQVGEGGSEGRVSCATVAQALHEA